MSIMKAKPWLKYFFIIVSILLVVFCGGRIFENLIESSKGDFHWNGVTQNTFLFVLYASIGLLLGIENLIQEIKKEGSWAINMPKLVLMGIPALYFSFGPNIYYHSNEFVRFKLSDPAYILIFTKNAKYTLAAFQVIFGYTLITSFYKKNKDI